MTARVKWMGGGCRRAGQGGCDSWESVGTKKWELGCVTPLTQFQVFQSLCTRNNRNLVSGHGTSRATHRCFSSSRTDKMCTRAHETIVPWEFARRRSGVSEDTLPQCHAKRKRRFQTCCWKLKRWSASPEWDRRPPWVGRARVGRRRMRFTAQLTRFLAR